MHTFLANARYNDVLMRQTPDASGNPGKFTRFDDHYAFDSDEDNDEAATETRKVQPKRTWRDGNHNRPYPNAYCKRPERDKRARKRTETGKGAEDAKVSNICWCQRKAVQTAGRLSLKHT